MDSKFQKDKNIIICSICEGRYAYGVGALINSSIKNGFRGQFHVLIKDELPFWAKHLKKTEGNYFINDYCTITFEKANWGYHLSYYKPFLLDSLIKLNPNSTIFYFDPDITIECDWNFFLDWVDIGPALCTDGNYPTLGKNHPWIVSWKNIFNIEKTKIFSDLIPYINSGFIGINSTQTDLIKKWIGFTNLLIEKGHNLKSFGPTQNKYSKERAFSICGDQDILNAVLISHDYDISLFGVDGMGFNGSSYLMFHNIGRKSWEKNFLKDFLITGRRISPADDSYLKNLKGTINLYSRRKLMMLSINIAITKLLQRVL